MKRVLVQGRENSALVKAIQNLLTGQTNVRVEAFAKWHESLEYEVERSASIGDVALVVTEVQDGGRAAQSRARAIREHNQKCSILVLIPRGWSELSLPSGTGIRFLEKRQTRNEEEFANLLEHLMQ